MGEGGWPDPAAKGRPQAHAGLQSTRQEAAGRPLLGASTCFCRDTVPPGGAQVPRCWTGSHWAAACPRRPGCGRVGILGASLLPVPTSDPQGPSAVQEEAGLPQPRPAQGIPPRLCVRARPACQAAHGMPVCSGQAPVHRQGGPAGATDPLPAPAPPRGCTCRLSGHEAVWTHQARRAEHTGCPPSRGQDTSLPLHCRGTLLLIILLPACSSIHHCFLPETVIPVVFAQW